MGTISATDNTITSDILNTMVNMRDELDSLIETIQIMNDKELMSGINSSKQDVIKGNVHEISSADELALVYESWIWQQWNAPPAAETDALISSVSVK